MSQYPPSPYQPPSPQQYPPATFDYYQPAGAPDVLGPNKRAAVMMFIVAAVTLIGALCCAGAGAMLPQLLAQNPGASADLEAQMPPGMSMDMLRVTLVVAAVLVLLLAVAFVVLGVFVRKGSKVAVVLSIVLAIVVLLYLLLNAAVSMVQQRGAPGQAAATVCMMAVPIGMLALLVFLLFGALRASGAAQALREQQMQQYWQYAYAQQMYAQQQQQAQQMQRMQMQQGQQPAQGPRPGGAEAYAPSPPPPPPPPPAGGSDAPPPNG